MNGTSDISTDIDGPDLNSPDLGSWIGARDGVVVEDVEDSPRDRPLLVEDYGVTDYEQNHPEPLSGRLRRETQEIPLAHRPVDPELLVTHGRPGRIVADESGATIALGDSGGLAAEEVALHLDDDASLSEETTDERLARIEAEIEGLVVASRRITEALRAIVVAFDQIPTGEPGELAATIQAAARRAHVLLLAAPLTTRD